MLNPSVCQRRVLRDLSSSCVGFQNWNNFSVLKKASDLESQQHSKTVLFRPSIDYQKNIFSVIIFIVHRTAGMGVFSLRFLTVLATATQLPAAVRRPQETTGLSGWSTVDSLASLHPSSSIHLVPCHTAVWKAFSWCFFLTLLFVANVAVASHTGFGTTKPNMGDERLLLKPISAHWM